MHDFIDKELPTLAQAVELLSSGTATSVSLTKECLNNIKTKDAKIGAFLYVNEEEALRLAEASDLRRSKKQTLGKLDGIPIALKDMILAQGMPNTAGSKILEGYMPPYDATVTEKLLFQGAVILGKLNQDEFAMGSSNEFSAYKPCLNPVDITRTPGGSSGGSAAAVAAGMCLGSLGTETGGSVRQPAAFCGVVGLKPSYGRVSRYGVVAFASSLDQVGPVAKDIKSTALLFESIAGFDERDSTSVNVPVPSCTEENLGDCTGLRVGVAKEFFDEGLSPEIRSAVEANLQAYKKAGATLVDITLPHLDYCVATYYVLATAEASSNLSRYDGVRYGPRVGESAGLNSMYCETRSLFGSEVKRRIMLGTYVLSAGYFDAYYLKAQKVRRKISQDFYDAFEQVDVIVAPTTPTTAFKVGEKVADPVTMYLNDIYTIGANLAGLCAISVPSGKDKLGLPIGTQVIAKPFNEAKLFQAAAAIENL